MIFSKQQQYKDTEDEIDLKIYHYNISINARIEFLKEQAAIARELSIDQNKFDYLSETDTNISNLIGINDGGFPFYNEAL